jgi:hypothetical protein
MSIQTPRYAEKHRQNQPTGGSGCLCLFFLIAGLIVTALSLAAGGAILGLMLAVLLILIAVLFDPKIKAVHWCGHCGNEVFATTITCSHCQTRLTPPRRDRSYDPIIAAFVICVFVIALLLCWLKLTS